MPARIVNPLKHPVGGLRAVASIWALAAMGCQLLPTEDLRTLSDELRPPAYVEPRVDELAEAVRSRSGVQSFEFAEDFHQTDPYLSGPTAWFLRMMISE